MKIRSRQFSNSILLAAALFAARYASCQAGLDTFTNPLLPSGADPWVTQWDGNYYYMNTTGANLTIWKSRDITDLKNATSKVVWTPPASEPYSHELWAPELHRL